MNTDTVAAAKALVEHYLDRVMAPDLEGARACVSDGLEITFTGGRRFDAPEETTAFNARRYAWVKKRIQRTDACRDPETGDVYVYNTGTLFGAWRDGTGFDGNRYIDTFVVRDGLIIRTEVWNDSAEILLDRAGLAEAPL
ncbi:nuclear transport factor 2 family protein [uncultured Roseobacter sp.]|uniref:nuclear transport factor 2 family protein n=1 Tax=uncultured Roseobacter sp. TaxID=114847 RepID=UPI0026206D9D|nr:nuclear transport factor 2 family protein [uncultured Roseobacter sp.]